MKGRSRFANAVMIMVYISLAERAGQPVSSTGLSHSMASNASQIRQLMGKLRQAELIVTSQGSARSKLARSSTKITLLDIYKAVEEEKSLLEVGCAKAARGDSLSSAKGGASDSDGAGLELVIEGLFEDIQRSAERAMNNITLNAIVKRYLQTRGTSPGWADPFSSGACL